MTSKYDKYIKDTKNDKRQKIKQGSIVFRKRHHYVGNKRKLRPKYYGPYYVVDTTKSDSYIIAPYDPEINKYNLSYKTFANVQNLKLIGS